jgi:hypothetical protein
MIEPHPTEVGRQSTALQVLKGAQDDISPEHPTADQRHPKYSILGHPSVTSLRGTRILLDGASSYATISENRGGARANRESPGE